MYFFALSHAPPPEVIEIATKMPVTIVPSSIAPSAPNAAALAADRIDHEVDKTTGASTGSSEGTIISLIAALVRKVDGAAVIRLASSPSMMPFDPPELTPHFDDDRTGRTADGGHAHRAEEIRQQARR